MLVLLSGAYYYTVQTTTQILKGIKTSLGFDSGVKDK